MKKLLWYFVAGIMLFGACGQKGSQENKLPRAAIREYVEHFLARYPEATLQDIYKGSFQDYFGPAHIVNDRERAKQSILREIAAADTFGGVCYEPCGWRGQYYRVNLSMVKDSLVTIDTLVDAFVESAQGEPVFSDEWIEEWITILQIVREVAPSLQGFAEDSVRIARLLDSNNYVMHHSRRFDERYCPHYRIVRHDVFEQKIVPNDYGK